VGDEVNAGDVLATVDTRSLKLAVLQAQTSVAQAELTLYNAEHPSSSTGSTKPASTKPTSPGANPSGLTTVSLDLAGLNAAVTRVNTAVTDEAKVCEPILAWINADLTGTTAEAASKDPTSAGSSTSGSSEPTASVPSTEANATAAATAKQLSAVKTLSTAGEPSEADLKACATARVEITAANSGLQALMTAINKSAGAPSGGGSKPGSGSGGSSPKVSKSSVASAEASLLRANQQLQSAESDLADAELIAPISGSVGTVGLSKGDSSSSGTITIIGTGNALLSIEVPLKTRSLLAVGATAAVSPSGSMTSLSGKVTNINQLETSGTSGDSLTYTTTVSVSDPGGLLATGAKASVEIPVGSVTGVVTVPASAVTPTGTGTGTVKVLASGSQTPTTTEVKIGLIGGGLVEITEGLTVGQVVVLADKTAAIPSALSNRGRSSTSSSATPSSSATASPAAKPSATASR
jgi:multidrug efflux pump subunit AcrA (membrane-fusion protein)